MQFEVRIPEQQESSRFRLVIVDAQDWFSALRNALQEVGEDAQLRNVLCDLENDVYRVTESDGGRVFQIREIQEEDGETEIGLTFDEPTIKPSKPLDLGQTMIDGLPLNQTFSESISVEDVPDTAKTEMNIPSFSHGLPSEDVSPATTSSSTDSPTAPSSAPVVDASEKPKKKKLAETMMMDFAAIIEAQDEEGAQRPETVEFSDFASKEEIEQSRSSIIVSEEAYTPEVSGPAGSSKGDDSLSDITGAKGRYQPGQTTEMLADVFMRASEIHDYGVDRTAAMKFVLELALNDVHAAGGGVMLTDLNSPNQELWFEACDGVGASSLQNLRIPMGQGIVGFYTQQALHQVIPDVAQEPRFQSDVLAQLGLSIGSLLVAPIAYQERVWGCIMLFNPAGRRPFTQGELSIMNYLAHTAGEYLSTIG